VVVDSPVRIVHLQDWWCSGSSIALFQHRYPRLQLLDFQFQHQFGQVFSRHIAPAFTLDSLAGFAQVGVGTV
jgi:hypothetical protein